MEIREIGESELPFLVEVIRDADPGTDLTVGGLVDWRAQADETIWVLATLDGATVGAGHALVGWHTPPDVGLGHVWVRPERRRAGTGTRLVRHLAGWTSARAATTLHGAVNEEDAESLAWAERRGFREIGRNSRLVLDLVPIEAPEVAPPAGITVAPWSELDGLEEALYRVFVEAEPDIPGEEDNEIASFEDWLANDMNGASDRRDAVFVARAGDEVVGYAKLSIPPEGGDDAFHDLSGVLRAWRGRGIAGALKRAQILWAMNHGFARLTTTNEERNEPIRRLNERHGYVVAPGTVTLAAPIAALIP